MELKSSGMPDGMVIVYRPRVFRKEKNMFVRTQPRRRPRGFTLLEVLLVVAILVALAAFAVPSLLSTQEGSQRDLARLTVNSFNSEITRYKIDTGVFPTTEQGLAALKDPPAPPPANWRGPYNKNPGQLDPWGSPYSYQFPGTRNQREPDIWSSGPDRQSGTADDIGNWPDAPAR
jgi:general secretion pathway protein G